MKPISRSIHIVMSSVILPLVTAACMAAPANPAASVPTTNNPTDIPMSPSPTVIPSPTPNNKSMASPVVLVTKSATLGSILTDANGKSLYIYTKDSPGVSNCYGTCATNWPPLIAAAGSTPIGSSDLTAMLGTITRTDGSLQVTANGLPLYYWIKDVNPGDTTGQGVGGVWFVLDPNGSIIK